ncbi:hypothetical protein N665_0532s0045 [Sinapis alba]|nr:hypothetical protein N665_0532s0045 [Sinapis alba]
MPVYAMSCFKFPVELCKKITKAGGPGFKDLIIFNQALLAKFAWGLIYDPDSLFSQVFKSRCYPNSDLISAPNGTRPSYAWRSILWGRELLKTGLRRSVGNEEKTLVWVDDWIFDEKPRRDVTCLDEPNLAVQELIDQET